MFMTNSCYTTVQKSVFFSHNVTFFLLFKSLYFLEHFKYLMSLCPLFPGVQILLLVTPYSSPLESFVS